MRGRAFRTAALVLLAAASVWSWNQNALASEMSGGDSPPHAQSAPDSPPDVSPPVVVLPAAPSIYDSVPEASLATSVATVNGDPVSVRLFERRLARNRFSAFRHFSSTSSARTNADFWTTPQNGETPAEWLKKQTLDDCVRIKVELGLAAEEGLIGSTTYAAFLRALDRENERRRKALAAGEPIYGPQQYREDEFFLYVTNNLRILVQKRLWEGRLHASEDTLREFYESVKDTSYGRGDSVTVWAIEVHYSRGSGYGESLTRDEAKTKIDEIGARLDAGERFEDVAAESNAGGVAYEYLFDFESRSMDKSHRASLRDEAMALSQGETSAPFESMSAFLILKCIEKKALGYQPFDEVSGSVERQYVEQEYHDLVADLVQNASVEVDQRAMDLVEVR